MRPCGADEDQEMGTFTTKLKLGGKAFVVSGGLDPTIKIMTVGQIRVIQSLPNHHDPVYKEEYMCVETGVGSGSVWTYGKNIFATKKEALDGEIALKQKSYKERAERDAYLTREAERKMAEDLANLARLKQKYEPNS
jgi:hypothetical protein